jgi:hypothetical protein
VSDCKLRCKETCIGAFMSPAAMVVVGISGCRYTELVYAAGPGHRKRQCARANAGAAPTDKCRSASVTSPIPWRLEPGMGHAVLNAVGSCWIVQSAALRPSSA